MRWHLPEMFLQELFSWTQDMWQEDAAPSELFTNPKNPRTREFLKQISGRLDMVGIQKEEMING